LAAKSLQSFPPSRKALIKGTLVWMLLVAVLTCSIRSQPTAPGSLLQHTEIFSTQHKRRKYDTPLLTVALTTLTHPNQRGSMKCCHLSCSKPASGTLSATRLRRAGSTSAAEAAPSSSQGGGEDGAVLAQADERRVKSSLEGSRHEPAFCQLLSLVMFRNFSLT